MAYWLVKTEPEVYSIDDLRQDSSTAWDSVRNYQARNYLTSMVRGDEVLIYHSNSTPPGIVGLAVVSKLAFPDALQFEKKSGYYDPKATIENPRWFSPELKFKKKFSRLISLEELRGEKKLEKMVLLQRGSRLSVHPVTPAEYEHILAVV